MLIICSACGKRIETKKIVVQAQCPNCGTVMLVLNVFELRMNVRPALILSEDELKRMSDEICKYAKVRMGLYGKRRNVTYIT